MINNNINWKKCKRQKESINTKSKRHGCMRLASPRFVSEDTKKNKDDF